jgi:hypothetical protein
MHLNVHELFEIISNKDVKQIDASMNHFQKEKNLEYIQYVLNISIDEECHLLIDLSIDYIYEVRFVD